MCTVRTPLKPLFMDVLLATVLTGLTLATLVGRPDAAVTPASVGLAVLSAAPLALRQRLPIVVALVVLGALGAASVIYNDLPNNGVGMLVVMFTVATLRSRVAATLIFVLAMVVTSVAFEQTGQSFVVSQVAQVGLLLVGAWVLGEGTRHWATRTERLAAQAAQAVSRERVRIARELHDIVTHHMSVISLQAGVAEYVIDADPATAKIAIATVGDASRAALLDMRRLLDVLHVDHGDASEYAPQPGLTQVPELVNRIRGAGLEVALVVTGQCRELPAGAELCAYRMIQESLTNVLKHAGPARARVEIDYGAHMLTVKVSDDGASGRPFDEAAAAHGIRGMRERAELYGGVLTAGPREEGGFTVLLRLPTDELR
ncbi:signal transduction histidine kinase [Pseudosporangium ferrugineum]|uniref:histidine kinase n=1 Tax=Pseudosporangium ferrugineum TaxID=439699 RepID=A0A2T0RX17_9ACTN|nr:signal transduction histidine kinase [Pseudosporangium ferrugineum]